MLAEIDLDSRRVYVTAEYGTHSSTMRSVAVAKLRTVPAPDGQEWSKHLGSASREECGHAKKLSWKMQSYYKDWCY